jgi:hypothetical protein
MPAALGRVYACLVLTKYVQGHLMESHPESFSVGVCRSPGEGWPGLLPVLPCHAEGLCEWDFSLCRDGLSEGGDVYIGECHGQHSGPFCSILCYAMLCYAVL